MSFYAAQVMLRTSPELLNRALANLTKVKNEEEPLLRRLDEIAREQGDESPLRVIEDLAHHPNDVAQTMTVVRRCLLASAFLGHCMAQPTDPQLASEALHTEKRLH